MDLRIRSNRELFRQLAYASSVIENCRTNIVRVDIDDGEGAFASIKIDRMITNLEIMKKYIEKEAALWRHLQAANGSDD